MNELLISTHTSIFLNIMNPSCVYVDQLQRCPADAEHHHDYYCCQEHLWTRTECTVDRSILYNNSEVERSIRTTELRWVLIINTVSQQAYFALHKILHQVQNF
jgi:hypothetical protein